MSTRSRRRPSTVTGFGPQSCSAKASRVSGVVDPNGELRADGTKLLKRKGQHVNSLS